MPWPAMLMMSPMMIAAPNFADKKSSILTAILFFIYPSIIFIILKLIGYTFYGTNPMTWAIVIFMIGMLATLVYQLPRQLINLFKGVSNYDYFIAKDAVYLNGTKLKGADSKTFVSYTGTSDYSKDANNVYAQTKKLANADAASFGPLPKDDNTNYWRDKKNAYYNLNIIADADGASFEYAGFEYAFDKKAVYFENKKVEGADRTTFKALSNNIGRDDSAIYIRATRDTNAIDLDSFKTIEINEEVFGKDKNQLYLIRYSPMNALEPFPNADLNSFEVLGDYYAKDKNQVYYYHYFSNTIKILKDASSATFKLEYNNAFNTDATDGTHFYKVGRLYEEAQAPV